MRVPSRSMPQVKSPSRVALAAWQTGIVCAFVALFWFAPLNTMFAVAGVVAVAWIVGSISLRNHRLRIAAAAQSRASDSICQFARSFDTRNVDTWIVRAVYEALQQELCHAVPAFPVKATDKLADLLLDPDDLDMTVAPKVSMRSGRSLENPEANPFYGKVLSVADLVMFFNNQPKVLAA